MLGTIGERGRNRFASSFVALGVASVIGCGSSSPPTDTGSKTGPSPQAGVGAISLKLTLGGDTEIDSVNYTLQNGTTLVESGTQATKNSAAINFELGSIPAGPGYTITLTAASPDGGVNCLGTSGVFSVNAHSTVSEQVNLICTFGAVDHGGAIVHGLENFCGTWQSVSTEGLPAIDAAATNGSEVLADGVTPLVITANGNGPATGALVYSWSVLVSTGGGVTLGTETGNGTTTSTQTLTCNPSIVAGGAVIQLVITDSIDGGAVTCPGTLSTVTVPVTCDPQSVLACSSASSTPDKCGTGASAFCTNFLTDNSNCGGCGNVCNGGAFCQAGVCDACADVQCQCNVFISQHEVGNTPGATCSGTELAAFMVDANTATAGSCLDCLVNPGQGLDNPSLGVVNDDCEDAFTGIGAGETTAECLAVLACDFGVTPPAIPAPVTFSGPGPVEGYCGTTDLLDCQEGGLPPNGACISQIVAGFPSSFSSPQIVGSIADKRYASGRAGMIVTAAQHTCPQCLAGSTL
jgi:hypothetical protein